MYNTDKVKRSPICFSDYICVVDFFSLLVFVLFQMILARQLAPLLRLQWLLFTKVTDIILETNVLLCKNMMESVM